MTITSPVTIPAAPTITSSVVLVTPSITAAVTVPTVSAGALITSPLASWSATSGVSGSPVDAWSSQTYQTFIGAGSGRPTISANFKPGIGIKFDGSNDIISTTDATVFPQLSPAGGCVIFAFRLTSVGSDQVIFSTTSTTLSNVYFNIGVKSSGKIWIDWAAGSAANSGSAIGTAVLSINTDYVIAVKVGVDPLLWSAYINGVEDALNYTAGANFYVFNNKWFFDVSLINKEFLVGATRLLGVVTNPFNGVIGTCRFWKPTLSVSDCLAMSADISSQWTS